MPAYFIEGLIMGPAEATIPLAHSSMAGRFWADGLLFERSQHVNGGELFSWVFAIDSHASVISAL